MRRITTILAVVALMVATVALTAMPAFAQVASVDVGETSISVLDLVNVNLEGIQVGIL